MRITLVKANFHNFENSSFSLTVFKFYCQNDSKGFPMEGGHNGEKSTHSELVNMPRKEEGGASWSLFSLDCTGCL